LDLLEDVVFGLDMKGVEDVEDTEEMKDVAGMKGTAGVEDKRGMEDMTRAEDMKNDVRKGDKYGEWGRRGVRGSVAKLTNLRFSGRDEMFPEGFNLKPSGKQTGWL
jgi:hypothetical protein